MILVTRGYGPSASIAAVVTRGYVSDSTAFDFTQPISDDVVDGWVPTGAATLSDAINEEIPSDTNYISSPSGPSFDVCRVKFRPVDGLTNPVRLSYRVSQDNTDQVLNLTTTLKEGSNTIALWSNDLGSTQWTTFTQQLSPAQVASIVDFNNLHLEFDANVDDNVDVLALLLTSQLGVGADSTHTTYTTPWMRITLGPGRLAGDTMQLLVNGLDDVSVVLSSTNISAGYVDIQLDELSVGSHSIQSCIVRSSNRSGLTDPTTITIFPYAFDNFQANLYAVHGVQKLLSSYTGPLCTITRTSDNATRDLYAGIDGYINMCEGPDHCRDQGDNPKAGVIKLYDQTGNGRHAILAGIDSPGPYLFTKQTTPYSSSPETWGWRAQVFFDGNAGTTDAYSVSNMTAFAQNIGAVSIAGALETTFWNSLPTPVSVSVNGSSSDRVAMIQNGNFFTRAGGCRLDADIEVFTPNISSSFSFTEPVCVEWSTAVVRADYTNAKLFYDRLGQSVSLDPFQTAGLTSNTPSTTVLLGANGNSAIFTGGWIGLGWWQRKLTDAEVTELTTTNQVNIKAIPRRHLFRAGAALGIEPFRQALISKLFVGSPYNGLFPTNGFTTTSTGTPDPYAGIAPAANLLRHDQHTITLVTDTGSAGPGVPTVHAWYPTVPTSNNKLVIYNVGYEGTASSGFNDPIFTQELIEAGYTVFHVGSPFGGGLPFPDPTSTLTQMRYYVEQAIRTCNAKSSTFDHTLLVGFSGGAPVGSLIGAIDPRFECTIVHDFVDPSWASTESRYERCIPGLAGLSTTTGCDFLDLWLLCTTGGTVSSRELVLSYVDSQISALQGAADFLDETFSVVSLYSGRFHTAYSTFDTTHHWTDSARALVLDRFDRY